ncbi:uncharacterized protein PG986_002556 [Apiospora aurea]|uniref:Uncharacterized protein n=1 Tax=Apiospora aurea TaxID=335848 RepID=A0ABR1QP53_9PEZI
MKSSALLSTLLTALGLLPAATQATWCQFYYDSACKNNANGGTSFNCGNNNVFGSGGGFVKCHDVGNACLISRCPDQGCGAGTQATTIARGHTQCVGTGGGGALVQTSRGLIDRSRGRGGGCYILKFDMYGGQ